MAIHEWAFEVDSDVYVHANDAIKSKPYRCTDPLCTQEIRRRAGSKTPHFYHLNPDADATCGGGEGPRHKRAKELIAKAFRESGEYKHVLVEYRVGNFIVDILLQTDYGPFYFEVIDTHAPEDANWAELDGRIIPFWITDFEEPSFDDMVLLRAFELMKYHFGLIEHKIMHLKNVENKRFDFSVEDVWYFHQIDGVLKWVQNTHRELKNYMPTYFSLLGKEEFDENEIKFGYLSAVKRLRDESRKE